MAKRKHSRALFEVITKAQPYSKPLARNSADVGVLSSAGRWFKKHMQVAPPAPVEDSTVAPAAAALAKVMPQPAPQLALGSIVSAPGTLTLVQTPPEDLTPAPKIEPMFDDEHDAIVPAAKVTMAVDHENRHISLRMSYTTAMLTAAAVVLVVGLTVVVLQHVSRGSALLLAEKTTDKIRAGPAQREVMEVPRRSFAPATVTNAIDSQSNTTSIPAGNRTAPDRAPVPSVASDGKRYIGLNYVIVQSYPLAEEKMAKDAAALLNKEGVSCTVETGVKGYLPLTVVGLQGFDKQSSPAFKAYVQRIQQISAKSSSSNHSYKAFAPVAKKWDKQD